MTGPMTDEDMILDRRINELTNEYETDYGKFMEWAQDDMTFTDGVEHAFLCMGGGKSDRLFGVDKLMSLYNKWCLAKACEDAKKEV